MKLHRNDYLDSTREIVKLANIQGTINYCDKIDSHFNPTRTYVNKRFRKVWKWIQNNPNNNENVIFPTDILLIKLNKNDYFVIEGLRRVVCLKYSKIKAITTRVLDYRNK